MLSLWGTRHCYLAGLEVSSAVYNDIYIYCSVRYYFSTLILATIFMFIIEENYIIISHFQKDLRTYSRIATPMLQKVST